MKRKSRVEGLGVGTLSAILGVIAIVFSFTAVEGENLGQFTLKSMGINFPFIIIAVVLYLIAIFLGYKFKEDKYAKAGMIISIIFLILSIIDYFI